MICPRCTVAEISAETHTCVLCGYSPGGVTLEVSAREELDEAAHRELAQLFQVGDIVTHDAGSIRYTAQELGAERRVILRVHSRGTGRDTRLDDRFQREMATVSTLDHPHIVPVLRFGTTKSLLWHASKHIEGRTLAALLEERRRLEPAACLRLVEQISSALQFAHRRGVVHGDVRPANIHLHEDWALLTGFSSWRAVEEGQVDPRDTAYAPPEAASLRQPVPASDQYALAATVLECLTGTPVLLDEAARRALPADDRVEIDPQLAAALRRALDPDPAKRFPSVSEFVSALTIVPAVPAPAGPPPGVPTVDPSVGGAEPRASQRVLLIDRTRGPDTRRRILFGVAVVAGAFLLYQIVREPARSPTVVIPGPRPAPAAPMTPDTATAATPVPPPVAGPATTSAPTRPPTTQPAPTARPVTGEPGRLYINSTPWGEVFVDDQPVGTTPQAGLLVSAGEHKLRVVREGYRPFEQTITIAPGQQIRLTNISLVAEQP